MDFFDEEDMTAAPVATAQPTGTGGLFFDPEDEQAARPKQASSSFFDPEDVTFGLDESTDNPSIASRMAQDILVEAPKELVKGIPAGVPIAAGNINAGMEAPFDIVGQVRRNIRRMMYDPEHPVSKILQTVGLVKDAPRKEAELRATVPEWNERASNELQSNYEWWNQKANSGWLAGNTELDRAPGMTGGAAGVVRGFARSAVPMVAAVGASAAGRPDIGSAILASLEAAPSYVRAKESGLPPAGALAAAAVSGIGTYYLEKIGLKSITGLNPAVNHAIEKLGDGYIVGAAINYGAEGGTEGLQQLYQNAIAMGYDKDQKAFDGVLQSVLAGGLGGAAFHVGTRAAQSAAAPTFAQIDHAELNLKQTAGVQDVKRLNDSTLTATTANGQRLAFQFVPKSEDLQGEQNPIETLKSAQDSKDATVRQMAAEALAQAEGNETSAGQTLIGQGLTRAGQTRRNAIITDEATGEKLKLDVLVQLVSGRATLGTLSHEQFHALAVLSGNDTVNGEFHDPQTGATLTQESIAEARAAGTDHPVVQKIKDFALRIMNMLRQDPQESLQQTAQRIHDEWTDQMSRGGESKLTPQAAAELQQNSEAAARAFDARTVDRKAEGSTILLSSSPERPASNGTLLDQFGKPIPGMDVPIRSAQGTLRPGGWEAHTPNYEAKVAGQWGVLEADSLLTSDREQYDQTLQPRNRDTVASKQQVMSIAKQPDPNRLMNSVTTDFGAPIVDPSHQVISGNGRTVGIRQAYDTQRAAQYRTEVVARAKALGMPEAEFMRKPVLVRMLTDTGTATLPEIAEWSNRPQILQRSDAEQAEADARMLMDTGMVHSFHPDQAGGIRVAGNRDFLRAFVKETGDASLLDAKGQFAPAIENRVKRSVLAAVIGDHPQARNLIQELIERADEYGVKRQTDGVMLAGPALLKIATAKPQYDVRAPLAQALQDLVTYQRGRQAGEWKSLPDFLAQQDMFETGRTRDSLMMLQQLDAAPTMSATKAWLDRYTGIVDKIDVTTGDMFKLAPADKAAVLSVALNLNAAPESPTRYSVAMATGTWNDSLRRKRILSTPQMRIYEAERSGKTVFETQLRWRGIWHTVQYANTQEDAIELYQNHDWYGSFIESARRQPWYQAVRAAGLSDQQALHAVDPAIVVEQARREPNPTLPFPEGALQPVDLAAEADQAGPSPRGDKQVQDAGGPEWLTKARYQVSRKAPDPLNIAADDEKFQRAITEMLNTPQGPDMPIRVTSTPVVLQRLGAANAPLITDKRTIKKVVLPWTQAGGKHGISATSLRGIVQELHEPLFVIRSDNPQGSMIVITTLPSSQPGNLVAAVHVAVRLQSDRIANRIASIHGRTAGWVLEELRKGKGLYADTMKARTWLQSSGLDVAEEDFTSELSANKLLTQDDFVNSEEPNARYQVTRAPAIHRTVPRLQNGEAYKAILTDIQKNPLAYYDTQNLASMQQALEQASEEELTARMAPIEAAASTDSQQNQAVLAAAERMKRLSATAATDPAARDAFRALTLKVSRAAGTWAQLVRQMAAIPGQTPEAVVMAVQTMLEESNITMTETDAGAIRDAATEDIKQRELLRQAEQMYILQPSAVNGKVLDTQTKRADEASRKMLKKQAEIVPKTWGVIIKNLIQANVLTPVSIVANTVGNIVNMPARGVAQTIAATTERLLHGLGFVKERSVGQPLADQWAWVQGMGQAVKNTPRVLATGISSQELLPGGEVYNGFQPLRAWVRMMAGGGKTANGTAKLLVEGTLGAVAEPMFRMLAVGDAPFYQAHYNQFLKELGRLKGLEGKKLADWTRLPDAEAKELATERAKAAVYHGKAGPLTSVMMQLANMKPESAGPEVADLVNALTIRPLMLFVKTPSQVLAEAHQFVNPAYSAGSMLMHASAAARARKAGKHTEALRSQREAMLALGRIGVGVAIWGAVNAMVQAGLLAGSGGKSEREKELARLRLKPYHFNLTGLKRLLDGQDPSMLPGDTQADYRNLGIIGLAMNIAASGDEIRRADAEKRGETYHSQATGPLETVITAAPALGSAMLDMSMLKGSYSLLQTIKNRSWGNFLAQYFETVSSVAMPNTLKAASRAVMPYMPDTEARAKEQTIESKWSAVGEDYVNRIATKLYIGRWMLDKAAGRPSSLKMEDLPPRIDLFGRTVPMTPPGRGPAYHLIDTLKAEQIPWDSYAQEVARVYRETNDSDVIPSRLESLTNPRTKQAIMLSTAEKSRLNQIAGMYTRWAIDNAIKSNGWKSMPARQQAAYLKGINARVARQARIEMLRELYAKRQ